MYESNGDARVSPGKAGIRPDVSVLVYYNPLPRSDNTMKTEGRTPPPAPTPHLGFCKSPFSDKTPYQTINLGVCFVVMMVGWKHQLLYL